MKQNFLICCIAALVLVQLAQAARNLTSKSTTGLKTKAAEKSKSPKIKTPFFSKCIQPEKIEITRNISKKAGADCLPVEGTTCSKVCFLQKHGFVDQMKNGSYSFNTLNIMKYITDNLVAGIKDGFAKNLQECIQKKVLTESFNSDPKNKCSGAISHEKCFVHAAEKSCKAILSVSPRDKKST